MKRNSCRLAALTVLMLGLAAVSHAAEKFDMYSWQKEDKVWCFSIVPHQKDKLTGEAAKAAKNQICGRHDVKRLMGMVLPEEAVVYWRHDDAQGLVFPPTEMVNDLRRFCTTMDFKMELPKGAAKEDAWE